MPSEAPSLLLRADAGVGIGEGHISRLLSLAEAWIAAGGRAKLLSFSPSPELVSRAGALGVELIALSAAHPDPADLAAVSNAIVAGPAGSWVAVDGYSFDASYLACLRAAGACVLRVDDGPRGEVPCDILLDQNAGADATSPSLPDKALPLLGPRWALLRPSFASTGVMREIRAEATRLLVSFGGVDPEDATSLALRALRRIGRHYEAVVVVGADNPRFDSIAMLSEGLPIRLERTADMPSLMAWADVALIGGGVTMLEACAAALPALIITVADNQDSGAAALSSLRAVRLQGRARTLDEEKLPGALDLFLGDFAARRETSARASKVVDGGGAARAVATLRAISAARFPIPSLHIRPAVTEDSREIWRIANDPAVRGQSFDPRPIPWETHSNWFATRLQDPLETFLVADLGCIAGYFRLTPFSSEALEVHFYVHCAFRGKGLGAFLLKKAQEMAFRKDWVEEVVGTVLPGNAASVGAFLSSGFFQVDGESSQHEGRSCVLFRSRRASAATTGKFDRRSSDG